MSLLIQKIPEKNGTQRQKRSIDYNKWLVFNNEDKMLKAIMREISFNTANKIGIEI